MNIQQLEYIVAVDRYRHFGKAAEACYVTQPTLSSMIQKLEEEIDIKVFDRGTHPIRTTDMGAEIVLHAKKIISDVNELKNKAQSLKGVLGGKLNLGIIPTVSSYLLPYQILGFLERYTQVDLQVNELTTDFAIQSLKTGRIDAAIISTPYVAAEEFYGEILFREELLLYSAETSKKIQADEFIAPEDIDPDRVWLLEEGNCLRNQFENICHLKENVRKPKNLEFLASNINSLLPMVDRLGGYTLLPELALKQLSDGQKNKVLRFVKPYPYREISIIYYKPTYKQKIINEFSNFIKKTLQTELNYFISPEDFVSISPE
ncbi:MAG: LysR family transcriptional regulator [Bergeyella sp.]|nr:LysR family transcriptional regulator [Bergeyella sp.]